MAQSDKFIPLESYSKIFLRFLRFGLLAWGGPIPQIAMIRQELVDEKKWISREKFNRVLGIYQALPGPEAHELCVYFGTIAHGRLGGFLAGLGFMLPGLILMLVLSWFYVSYGVTNPALKAVFFGFQAAVVALIIRAVHRIGYHAVTNWYLLAISFVAGISSYFGTNFVMVLILSGIVYYLLKQKKQYQIIGGVILFSLLFFSIYSGKPQLSEPFEYAGEELGVNDASPLELLESGLKSGLLTFGGAYTVIPFLQNDAVINGHWLTNSQFLEGLGLSGVIPAPLVIIGTFVGYMGGGLFGALVMTFGIFLPAFAFTLVGHGFVEKLVERNNVKVFLDGVTAAVVGLIVVTSIHLAFAGISNWLSFGIFVVMLSVLYLWKSKITNVVVVLASGCIGLLQLVLVAPNL